FGRRMLGHDLDVVGADRLAYGGPDEGVVLDEHHGRLRPSDRGHDFTFVGRRPERGVAAGRAAGPGRPRPTAVFDVAGTRRWTFVPSRGRVTTSISPPMRPARSRIPRRP